MYTIKKGKPGASFQYEASFKRKVITELLSGTITKAELRRKYSLSAGAIYRWLLWYEQDQTNALSSLAMNEDAAQPAQQQQHQAGELEALREELRMAQIKLACLETLIDLTEKDLGIDIRKKAGTRSSAA